MPQPTSAEFKVTCRRWFNRLRPPIPLRRQVHPMADQGSAEVMGRQVRDRPPKGVIDHQMSLMTLCTTSLYCVSFFTNYPTFQTPSGPMKVC